MSEINKDLIYSFVFHIILIFLISTMHFPQKRLRFYEVSLEVEPSVKIPDLKERKLFKKRESNKRKIIRGDEPIFEEPVLREEFEERPELKNELKEDELIEKDFSKDISPDVPDRELPLPEGKEISGPVSDRTILRKIYPVYPDVARLNGWEGEVKLKFWVEKDGIVSKVEILKTSGYSILDEEAISSIKKWLFSPYKTTQWGEITFRFKLK